MKISASSVVTTRCPPRTLSRPVSTRTGGTGPIRRETRSWCKGKPTVYARNPDVASWNPDFKGKVVLGVDEFKKTGHYFDRNAFVLPAAGTFGNVARGALRGPGFFNVNTSFFKRIPLKERLNMQFRVEAFNVLNHANFRYPELIVFSGSEIAGSA